MAEGVKGPEKIKPIELESVERRKRQGGRNKGSRIGRVKALVRAGNNNLIYELFNPTGDATVTRQLSKGGHEQSWYITPVPNASPLIAGRIQDIGGSGAIFRRRSGGTRVALRGILHRNLREGPAVIAPDRKEWWVNGELRKQETESEVTHYRNIQRARLGRELSVIHREDGPAIVPKEKGKHALWFLYDTHVSEVVVMHPENLPDHAVRQYVSQEPNFINFFLNKCGDRLLSATGAHPKAEDAYGKLYEIPHAGNIEAIRVLEVINGTPESDGTYKHYYKWVPTPGDRRFQGGAINYNFNKPVDCVAWTYGVDPAEYEKSLQKRT